jgi:adenylate cyclase
MTRIIFTLTFSLFCGLLLSQTADELIRDLQQATTAKEKMLINFQIAETYMRGSDREKAIDYARTAHQSAIEQSNNGVAARSAYLIGDAYERLRNDKNAETWYKTCLNFAKSAGDFDLIVQSVKKRSKIATKDGNYRRAYEINQEAFDFFSGKGTSIADLEGKFDNQKVILDREKRALVEEKNRLEREIASMAQERDQLSTDKTQLESRQQELVQQKAKVEEQITVKEQALVSVAEEKRKVEEVAIQKEAALKNLSREKLIQEAALNAAQKESAEAQLAVEKEQSLREQEQSLREKTRLQTLLGAAVGALVLFFMTLLYLSSRRAKANLQRKNKLIEMERERSDELLFNILPKSIGEELKEFGKARARKFEQATVLFTDFKNFTKISETLSPEDLVAEIDRCFKGFDFIISQYPDIEKIKTIGDAYMCASGLSEGGSSPDNLLRAALEMQEFLDEQRVERQRLGKPYFEARIGLHTGPVVAGVVGVNKFAYDIWGDTVNIAARMESQCEEGHINISETTYNLVRYSFECTYRGKVEAKNKGAIDMYYVERELARSAVYS